MQTTEWKVQELTRHLDFISSPYVIKDIVRMPKILTDFTKSELIIFLKYINFRSK